MANICSTELIIFHPERKVLEDLKSKLDKFIHIPAHESLSHNTYWIGNLLLHAGYNYTDIVNDKYGDTRSWVAYLGEIEQHITGGVYFFAVDLEDSWGPHIAPWRYFLNKLYPDAEIKLAWMAEECGCELYQKYDPDSLFYADYEYFVDCYVPDNSAYDKYPELVDEHRGYSADELREIFNVDDMDEIIATANSITEKLQEEYGDGFYNVNAFQVMEEEF